MWRKDVAGTGEDNHNGGLNESQKLTLEYIRQHEGCQVKQISADLNVPIDTIDKHISVLLKGGAIKNQGDRNFYTRFYVPEKCV